MTTVPVSGGPRWANTTWRAFRRWPVWLQVLAWIVGFWLLGVLYVWRTGAPVWVKAIASVAVAILVIGVVVSASSGNSKTKPTTAAAPTAISPTQGTTVAAAAVAATKAPVTTKPPTVASTPKPKPDMSVLMNGMTAQTGQLAITLVSIVDPYTPDNQYIRPAAGNRYVNIHVIAKDVSNNQQNVNELNFQVKTADSHVYDAHLLVTGHDLNATSLRKGDVTEGDVVFEVPQDAQLVTLRYDGGFGNDDLTWTAAPQ